MTNKNNLIWIDLEMTGLSPQQDRIIEIATLVTDSHLTVIAEGPILAVKQSDQRLAAMDDWNQVHHKRSGLIERVKQSTVDENVAEQQTLDFLKQYVKFGCSPMCGNTICQDRRFLALYMPNLEKFFHYRHLDVSSLKILAQRWYPDISAQYQKESKHMAMDDIKDSLDELRFYRQHLFIDS